MKNGTNFVFKQKSPLVETYRQIKLGNDDVSEVFESQQSIQTAVSGMSQEEITKEFGDIELI